ncbi:MAG: hypothetical protein V4850_17700 [Myxococcota bacterium]
MPVDRELLMLLGLPDADSLRAVESVHPPPEATAQGAGLPDLVALLALLTAWGPVGAGDAPVYRAKGFIAVPSEYSLEVLAGAPVHGEQLVGFDTRERRVVLRVSDDLGQTWIVDARSDSIDTYGVVDALADLPDLPLPPPLVDAPDLRGWASRIGAEPWLAAAAAQHADAPSSVDRMAAVGLLARLWTPPEGAAPPAHPRDLARAWARAVEPAVLDEAESVAVRRAWRLSERIAEVGSLSAGNATDEMTAIVLDRDDLQSVRRVLRLVGAGDRLADALATADAVANEHLSALADLLPSLADDPEADRWNAVAWQEPDAWWVGA